MLFALLLGAGLPFTAAIGQQGPRVWNPSDNDPEYNSRKLAQVQPGPAQTNAGPTTGTRVDRPSCFEPFSNTGADGWTALPRNDDGSIGPIALGWNFSLFGTVYNSVYINNNGNLTFASPLSAFTPGGFPISTPMVAAFWGDVDTRPETSGRVWYKVFPDRLVVTYDHVGYFPNRVDLTNTFQLIIKANTAPGFSGNDVIFAYEDMQWTTGGASSGVNGFGGAAATVGANRGNNVDFIQTGRFNINSNQAPNIPSVGSPGGVSFLDGLCLGYRVGGGSGNVPPSVAGLPNNNTITLNRGDTFTFSLQFSASETTQNVNVTANTTGICNATATVTSNDTPNPNATVVVVGADCNAGRNIITFLATDNGTPAATQSFTIAVVVNPPPEGNAPPIFNGPLPDQTGTVGIPFGYALPINAFTDPNNDALSYSVSGLPPGITFGGGTFAGVPTMVGAYTVVITATDPSLLSATGSLLITIGTLPPPPPPPSGPFSITSVTTVSCITESPNSRLLTFTPQYDGLNGQPVSFSVVNELPPTTSPGPYTLRVYLDNPIITLQAQQTGSSEVVSFPYTWAAFCSNIPPPPPPTPGSFAIVGATTVSCEIVSGGERRLTFMPQYTGLTGQPISFSVVNELSPTTSPGPYTLRVYVDNPTLILRAQQTGSSESGIFAYNWIASCGSSNGARLGAEPTAGLNVTVLGNPVAGETIDVEVRGAAGGPLRLQLLDTRGRRMSETLIEKPTPGQRATLQLGRQPGLYFLQAIIPGQKQTLKIVKQ
ncbi:hypothetical protein GCM10027423_35870 [Spirosoma arcticum]